MNQMVRFMQSCLKFNNTSLNMLSSRLFTEVVHICLKVSITYFHNSNLIPRPSVCSMNTIYFYNLIPNHCQKRLDEKLLNKVSFAKDVLHKIENASSPYFFNQRRVALIAHYITSKFCLNELYIRLCK